MSRLSLVYGGQWGSEGKGQLCAAIARDANPDDQLWAVRVGGPNAGHTVTAVDGRTVKVQQIPSPAFTKQGVVPVIGCSGLILPEVLDRELDLLYDLWGPDPPTVFIDHQAVVITEEHMLQERGLKKSIASTGEGVGAATADKVMRKAATIEDMWEDLCETYHHWPRQVVLTDTVPLLNMAADEDDVHVIIEGTQGYLLSLSTSGYYPFCVHADSVVDVRGRGHIPISEAKIGDWVSDGVSSYARILNVWTSQREVFEVWVGDKRVLCSEDHRHVILRDGRKTVVPTSQLEEGDEMYTPPVETKPKRVFDANRYELYLMGYLIGDGWITDTGEGKNVILSYCGKDLSSVKLALNQLGIPYYISFPNVERVKVFRRGFIQRMQELGLHALSYEKRLPVGFEGMDQTQFGALLAGIIDSDGTLYDGESSSGSGACGTRIRLGCTSWLLVQQLQRWFDLNDLRTNAAFLSLPDPAKQDNHHWKEGTNSRGYTRPVYRWDATLDGRFETMAEEINLSSRKAGAIGGLKLSTSNRAINPDNRGNRRFVARAYRRRHEDSPVTSVVRRVRPLGFKWDMVDLETESEHFWVNGVLTHNCTSRECGPEAIMGQIGLSFRAFDEVDVVCVMRTYPIRVGGNSGPLPGEITWEELGRRTRGYVDTPERTTVTNKIRRIAEFNLPLALRTIKETRPTSIALTFLDYVFPGDARREWMAHLSEGAGGYVEEMEGLLGVPIEWVSTGPGQRYTFHRLDKELPF